MDRAQRQGSGFIGGSRHSSLNNISSDNVDQLSMNFGKERAKQFLKINKKHLNDSNSVASILTKGGTVMNPFNIKLQDGSPKNMSTKVRNPRFSGRKG